MYLECALKILEQAKKYYSGWVLRYYIDRESVPADLVKKLSLGGAEVIMKSFRRSKYECLFWRFLVACDPQVDIYIIRDADSEIIKKDRQVVDEWLASGRDFHIVRDHPSHRIMMPGGLWGGREKIAGIDNMIERYIADRTAQEIRYGIDQEFLAQHIYKRVRHSVCIHSSYVRHPFELTLPSHLYDLSEGKSASFLGEPSRVDDRKRLKSNSLIKEIREKAAQRQKKPYPEQQLNITCRNQSISWLPFYRFLFLRQSRRLQHLIFIMLRYADHICIRCGIYPFFAGCKKKSS